MFYSKGFTCKNITFQACEVIYHPQCIRVGSPFRTRHYGKGTRGTQYPPSATILPFICELCTTRTHLQRELDPNCQQDALLLMLERMRMIDTAHAWDHKTVQNMCNTLKGVDQFFSELLFTTNPSATGPITPETPTIGHSYTFVLEYGTLHHSSFYT